MTLALSGLPQFISRVIAEQPDPPEAACPDPVIYPYVFWTAIGLWATTFFLCRCYRSGHGETQDWHL